MDTTAQTTTTDHNIWTGMTATGPRALRAWLVELGFIEGVLVEDGDLVHHSEMLWPEGGRVMISSGRTDDPHFTTPVGGAMVYVVTDRPDEVHERAQALGATVTRPLEDTDDGSRGFSILDPEGNSWSFGTYAG
ncbi:VOC family protein [Janibacter anophelis]|uniref:VOC family protein n=1 Tax=Janibacter anophelis TaxID=319054 RepID=UPI003F7DD703